MNSQQPLKGKAAIVTGGGKGIGRAITLAFAEAGASLVICGRHFPLLEQVSREAKTLGAAIIPLKADVTRELDVEKVMAQAVKAFGKIDILVNNSGIPGPLGLITEYGKKEWDEVINTNVTGMFLCSRAALKRMLAQNRGNIIYLSSGAGIKGVGLIRSVPYNVSKFAVEGLTYALSKQLKPFGICVNALRPGMMDTDFHKDSPPDWKAMKMRPPEDVKKLAVFLALQTADTMTGQSIDLSEWEKDQPS